MKNNYNITITVKFFVVLRKFGPAKSIVRMPENGTIKYLLDKYRIPKENRDLMILVNGLPHQKAEYSLNQGDVVAIFPPTAGG